MKYSKQNFHKPLSLLVTLILILTHSGCDKKEDEPVPPNVLPVLEIKLKNTNPYEVLVEVSIPIYGSKLVKEQGFVWSESNNPTINDNKYIYTATARPKTYSDTVNNLKLNTTYYFKAYFINQEDEITYSAEASIKTFTHQLDSFSPASASPDMEVTIKGKGFKPEGTTVYVNDIRVDATGTSSLIKFLVPFGLQVDSANIAVEIEGVKLAFQKKMQYKKGRWTKVKSLSENNLFILSPSPLSINNKGYVKGPSEIYEYTPETDSWNKIANGHPNAGYLRWFSIGSQIFAESVNSGMHEFEMYDLAADLWYPMPPRPSLNPDRYFGLAFSINYTGYIGLGYGRHDLWKFTPDHDWIRLNDFPGNGTSSCIVLTIEETAYVIGGSGGDNDYPDLWKYNSTNDTWEKKSDYPGGGRANLAGFVIGNKLYVGAGSNNGNNKDFWEYNPSTDKWTAVADFIEKRQAMYSFSLNNKGYAGGGFTGGIGSGGVFDLWKFEIE